MGSPTNGQHGFGCVNLQELVVPIGKIAAGFQVVVSSVVGKLLVLHVIHPGGNLTPIGVLPPSRFCRSRWRT